jgi:hypothetical protein
MADLRKCIGSTRFGIEPHEAPVENFPKQPSQKDGLGRMCTTHWNQYTAGLARDAKARKAAATEGTPVAAAESEAASSSEPAPKTKRRTAEATSVTATPGEAEG